MSYRDALSFFNLKDNYTEKELKSIYYNLAKKNHPDQNQNKDDDDMKKINLVYDILSTELKKRKNKDLINKWKNDISKLKDKYENTKIYDLCVVYENKIENLTNYKDISDLIDKFNIEITKLKQEIALPIEKRKIIKSINKYLDGYSLEVKELVSRYSILMMNTTSFEKLNTLKQKLDILLKEELTREKSRKSEFKNLKDSFKRASVYRFLEYSKNDNLNNILYAHNELILTLMILDIAKLDNMKVISELLDNIKYQNIEEEYNKLKELYFKLINRNDYVYEKLDIDNKNINSDELINLILDKYYLYVTNKNTKLEKIIQNEKVFKDIIIEISNLDDIKKNTISSFIEKESYKDIKIMLDVVDDFLDPSKIYIERSTGEICVINTNYKKIYTLNLDGVVKNNLKNKHDIFWKFMSLMKFFSLSSYSYGNEIDEMIDDKIAFLGDYDVNFLYYTDNLLLGFSEKDNQEEFNFLPSLPGYKYVLGRNSQITRNDYFKKYSNKDTCLMDLLLYIKNKIYQDNNKKVVK